MGMIKALIDHPGGTTQKECPAVKKTSTLNENSYQILMYGR